MYTYKDGSTALHLAAYNGHLAVVTLLLEAGASINAKDNVSTLIACMYKQTIIWYLLQE